MRLEEHIGNDDLLRQFRVLAFEARILMIAHVEPRPAIEAAFLHMGDVIGHQIVAELSRSFTEHHS